MRAFIGPAVLFVVGLLAWLFLAPRVGDGTLAMLLMWGGNHRRDRRTSVGGLHRDADAGPTVTDLTRVEKALSLLVLPNLADRPGESRLFRAGVRRPQRPRAAIALRVGTCGSLRTTPAARRRAEPRARPVDQPPTGRRHPPPTPRWSHRPHVRNPGPRSCVVGRASDLGVHPGRAARPAR